MADKSHQVKNVIEAIQQSKEGKPASVSDAIGETRNRLWRGNAPQ